MRIMEFNWADKEVLIVEDEEINYKLLEKILEYTHIKVHRAGSGEEAVALLNTGLYVDIVLMDIQLPDTDGFKLTEVFKEMHPDLPVIAHTFIDTDELHDQLVKSKFDALLQKPINMNKFLIVIDKFL